MHSDGRETFEALADVAARHGLRRRTQANEQVDTAIALERYGPPASGAAGGMGAGWRPT